MAIVAGSLPPVVRHMNNSDVSVDLEPDVLGVDFLVRSYRASNPMSSGAPTFNEPISVNGALAAPGAAFYIKEWGDYWFERIHVLPPVKAYPFILSPQHLFVEVYNAWRAVAQSVGAVLETGPTGVSIVTPHGVPIAFAPLQSRTYDILIDAAGAPRADNFIQWDFTGLAEPILHLTGLRLLPFTIPPDWDAGIDDAVRYVTDVMTAYDDTEQRMMLRVIPNRSLSYKASGLDTRESGLLASLLWSWQARSYGVLLWMDGSPLLADVVAGSVDLIVDTTNMTLQPGDTVIVLSDAFNWFASPVEELTAGSIKLETVLDRDFFLNRTQVIPVILGNVADSVPMARPTNASTIVQIKFDLKVISV